LINPYGVIYLGPPSNRLSIIYVGPDLDYYQYQVVTTGLKKTGIPRNYDEFAALYMQRIASVVAGFPGIERDRVEDITQEIMMQLIRGNYLEVFNPEKSRAAADARYKDALARYESGEIDFKPQRFTGKFSSFVIQCVQVRLRGMRDKANRELRSNRSLDTYLDGVTETDETTDVSYVNFFGRVDEEFENITVRDLCQKIHTWLVKFTLPAEQPQNSTRNFPELFKRMIDGGMDEVSGMGRKEYAREKGITVSAVSMQINQLTKLLRQAGFYKDLVQLNQSRHKRRGY
jgi:hypothetical protein